VRPNYPESPWFVVDPRALRVIPAPITPVVGPPGAYQGHQIPERFLESLVRPRRGRYDPAD